MGISNRDIGTPERLLIRDTTGKNNAARADVLHKRRNETYRCRYDRDDSCFAGAANANDIAGEAGHDAGFVETCPDDHHRNDRDDSIRGKPVEDLLVVYQAFLKSE